MRGDEISEMVLRILARIFDEMGKELLKIKDRLKEEGPEGLLRTGPGPTPEAEEKPVTSIDDFLNSLDRDLSDL